MKRVLFLMIQPPGGTGVQGLRYSKLFPFTVASDWQIHFAGPSPRLTSISLEPVVCPASQCHYTNSVSWSTRFATLKHRHRKKGLRFLFYGCLQLAARVAEKLTSHDSIKYLCSGILDESRAADDHWNFDLIAAKSPDFRILELGARLAMERRKPFLALFDDPHGQRDEANFYPDDKDRQIKVLRFADGVIFMSPMTRDRYVMQGLVEASKTYCLTDSYPLDPCFYSSDRSPAALSPQADVFGRFVHLGNLPEWRPIDPLLEALLADEKASPCRRPVFELYGYVYPAAAKLIQSYPVLANSFVIKPAVGHLESHHVAAQADVLLVMIGARHLDNQPSKFFVYLGHRKPVLVIGPPGNPIEHLVNAMGIGVYCDVKNVGAIRKGLDQLLSNYAAFCQAFDDNEAAIRRFRADAVAADLLCILDATLASARQRLGT